MEVKDLCLQSIDHCKLFQPIAEELGIEPDTLLDSHYVCPHCEERLENNEVDARVIGSDYEIGCPCCREMIYINDLPDYVRGIPTWRQDKLELALPGWLFHALTWSFPATKIESYIEEIKEENGQEYRRRHLGTKIERLYTEIIKDSLGEPKRQATVELVCLLKEEGLL